MSGFFQEFRQPAHLLTAIIFWCKVDQPSNNTEIGLNPNNQDAINRGRNSAKYRICRNFSASLSHASTLTQLLAIEALVSKFAKMQKMQNAKYLLPILLQAGLAGEVAGVVDGLQLSEDATTGQDVHPANTSPSLDNCEFVLLLSQTNQLHSSNAVHFFLSAQHGTTFPLAVSLPTEVRQSRTRPLLDTPGCFHQSESSFQIWTRVEAVYRPL